MVSGKLWLPLYGRLTCICHLLHAYVLVLFCPRYFFQFDIYYVFLSQFSYVLNFNISIDANLRMFNTSFFVYSIHLSYLHYLSALFVVQMGDS